jgi:hypothetical protein
VVDRDHADVVDEAWQPLCGCGDGQDPVIGAVDDEGGMSILRRSGRKSMS